MADWAQGARSGERRRQQPRSENARKAAISVAIVLVMATLAGGGGLRYGLLNLLVQLTAIAALATNREAFISFWRTAPLAIRTVLAFTLLLPLLQVIPLPPDLWSSLPGRDLVATSLSAIGREGSWMPFSLEPRRTLLALSALITPVAVLAVGWNASRAQIVSLAWVLVLLGALNIGLGTIQFATWGSTGYLYTDGGEGRVLAGTFANRNSTGLLLIGALCFAALAPSPRPVPNELVLRLGVCALLLIGIVLTRSRTALVLSIIPLILAGFKLLAWSRTGAREGRDEKAPGILEHRGLLAGIGAAMIALLLASLVVFAPGRVAGTLERFENLDDARVYIWEDAIYSASRYWPAGAGMGTFDEIFQVDESLENMTARRAGRAHNDFIELAIEAGLPGLLIAAAWLCLLACLCWQCRSAQLRWLAWAAGGFLMAVALQSITDYPLRNQTLLALAGFAVLVIARIAHGEREPR